MHTGIVINLTGKRQARVNYGRSLPTTKIKEDPTNTHLTFSTLLISFENIYGVAATVNLMYTGLEP